MGGGGVIGSATAYHCAKHGLKTLLIEQVGVGGWRWVEGGGGDGGRWGWGEVGGGGRRWGEVVGGIIGSATVYHCAKHRLKTLLIEQVRSIVGNRGEL